MNETETIDRALDATPRGHRPPPHDDPAERAAATLQAGLTPLAPLPEHLRARIEREGRAVVAPSSPAAPARRPFPAWSLVAIAASLALLTVGGSVALQAVRSERTRATELAAQLADARSQAEDNARFLEAARERADAESIRALNLADRLARASADLEQAELRIASLTPAQDQQDLQVERRRLLDLPGTVRLAWQPFDLPDAPAEQRGVQGDVVWNDDLKQGYLRFVGLDPNDPDIEQYQVWVIDERGMEQKISGGVFNASASGEIIVPIDPGIPVGRVQLFAVTVENPGGTWVPDLQRRLVVAPRDG